LYASSYHLNFSLQGKEEEEEEEEETVFAINSGSKGYKPTAHQSCLLSFCPLKRKENDMRYMKIRDAVQ